MDRPGRRGFHPAAHHLPSREVPRSFGTFRRTAVSALRLAARANPRLAAVCAAAQLVVALLLALQVLLGKLALEQIIDASSGDGSVAEALPALAGLVAAGALTTFGMSLQSLGERLLGEHVQRLTLDSMLEVTTSVDLETFESPDFFDDLQRAQANALLRPLQMARGLIQTLGGVLGSVGIGLALIAIEPLLVPIMLITGLPLWFISRHSGRLEFAFNVAQTPGARMRFYLVQVLIGRDEAKELRAFGTGDTLRERWHREYATYLADLGRHVRRRLTLALGGAIVTTIATTAAFALLVAFLVDGRLELAGAGAAVLAIRLLATRIDQIFAGVTGLFESSLFLDDLERFLRRTPVPAADGRVERPVEPFATLALRDVRFRYPGTDHDVLRDVSLDIDAGEVVALVGENGSGKTTLAKLVAGLFTATGGQVLWDDADMRDLDRVAVRRHVGVVFQDFVRYQLTARENIGYGRVEAMDDDALIADAARQAGAHAYLERLPDGYATLLGKEFSGGHDLSVGQWQRIALARAFFREPHLLVLDEPTASLDARSENDLFERVSELAEGRSVLLISHRFSTVRSADRIYVLHQGEIVEQGSHDELVGLDGRYAELYDLQARGYRA